jgi:hypothetical protein
MPIFRGIEEGRADKNYNLPEMDDMIFFFDILSSNIIFNFFSFDALQT